MAFSIYTKVCANVEDRSSSKRPTRPTGPTCPRHKQLLESTVAPPSTAARRPDALAAFIETSCFVASGRALGLSGAFFRRRLPDRSPAESAPLRPRPQVRLFRRRSPRPKRPQRWVLRAGSPRWRSRKTTSERSCSWCDPPVGLSGPSPRTLRRSGRKSP